MHSYVTTVDRIYKRFSSDAYDNVAYLHHPSGVTVVVLRNPPTSEVIEVNFGPTKKSGVDRSTQTVVGKGKKGGLLLQRETRLCTIKCKDGTEIVVRAGLKGTLAEVNARLQTEPDLVRTAPENQGYIGVVTYGAGKRQFEGLGSQLPIKRVYLRSLTPEADDHHLVAKKDGPDSES